MASSDLRSRMISIMKELSEPYGRYKWLEANTGVPAQRWANLYNIRQQPSIEQVEALGKLAPNLLEWMVTGKAGSYQVAMDDPLRVSKLFIWMDRREEIEALAKQDEDDLLQKMTAEEKKLDAGFKRLRKLAQMGATEAEETLPKEDLKLYRELKQISERRERDGNKGN